MWFAADAAVPPRGAANAMNALKEPAAHAQAIGIDIPIDTDAETKSSH